MAIFARAATKAFDQGVGTLAVGAHILQLGAGRANSGVSVTTDRAMAYAAFWAAVRLLSEDQAKLPLSVHEALPDGSSRPAPGHPIERAIRYAANPEMSAFDLRQTSMVHGLTWGNSYAFKQRDANGYVRQLWLLSTDRMVVDRDDAGELDYRYTRKNGTLEHLGRGQVFHVPGLSWDGLVGYSIIRQARETVGLGLAAEEHGARFFGQGATASFVLASPNRLSDDSLKRLNAQVKAERTGLKNSWEPWVLEEGLEPKTLSIPNDDAQWLETRKHQVTDIARWFRIPRTSSPTSSARPTTTSSTSRSNT